MINIVIFSKNRACQLDACLRSFKMHFAEWKENAANTTIVFDASNDEYKKGYERVIKFHPEFKFVLQTIFRENTIEAISDDNPYTMFLVDDIVFKDDFSLEDSVFSMLKGNNQMLAVSLRLHRRAKYCYAIDNNMRLPNFVRHVEGEYMAWKYRGCDGDWGYGLSVDGNIYNTQFIKFMISQISFTNPNELEAQLNSPYINSGLRPIYMCCYDGISKLLNVPANRVQNKFKNRNEESHDPKNLNDQFLNGEHISLKNITGIDNISVHYPLDYEFEKE